MKIQAWEKAYQETRRSTHLRKRRIRRFGLSRDACILDLGCGDGLDMHVFDELGHRKVFALDNSFELIKRAPVRRFPGVVADAYEFPFPDGAFDVVHADSVLHHLPDIGQALTEVGRVLRMGGLFCFTEPRPSYLRRAADALTLSPLGRALPWWKHRAVTLSEEMPLMSAWLASFPNLMDQLQEYGFEILMWQTSLLSVQAKCRKNTIPPPWGCIFS